MSCEVPRSLFTVRAALNQNLAHSPTSILPPKVGVFSKKEVFFTQNVGGYFLKQGFGLFRPPYFIAAEEEAKYYYSNKIT